MKWIRGRTRFLPAAMVLACLAAVTACADSTTEAEPEGVAKLAGTWQASEFVFTHNEHAGVSFNLVQAGGTIQLSIQDTGTFNGMAVIPGVLLDNPDLGLVTVPLSGVIRLMDSYTLRIDYIPEIPPVFTTQESDFTLVGNTLTVEDQAAVFDFDGDGVGEPGTFFGSFTRN